ncbi:hypothetical protein RJ641_018545 [Dillenia turbinata]|uniref:Peptidase S8/S53 domain-containing protein n=1 Tax=Dillenia turbinata TaxID=194707 RepID=A0AAN8URJ3_9MAGN
MATPHIAGIAALIKRFIGALPNVDPATIKDITGELCNRCFEYLSDLKPISVTITALNGSKVVQRTVKNAGNRTETYLCSVFPPNGTSYYSSTGLPTIGNSTECNSKHLMISALGRLSLHDVWIIYLGFPCLFFLI